MTEKIDISKTYTTREGGEVKGLYWFQDKIFGEAYDLPTNRWWSFEWYADGSFYDDSEDSFADLIEVNPKEDRWGDLYREWSRAPEEVGSFEFWLSANFKAPERL